MYFQYTISPTGQKTYDLIGITTEEAEALNFAISNHLAHTYCADKEHWEEMGESVVAAAIDNIPAHKSLHMMLIAMIKPVPSPAQVSANDQKQAEKRDRINNLRTMEEE